MRCGWGSSPLTYSSALEADALAWARTCPTPGSPRDPSSTDGENVYLLNPGASAPYTGDIVTQLWAAEASLWACAVDRCADSVSGCLNFRQIVWSTTTSLGCAAVSNCPGAYPVVYVCRYRAAGNIVGQHPLANAVLQCPLNGGGSCNGTTSSTTGTTFSSTSTSGTATPTAGPTVGPTQEPTYNPTYPPTCSAAPKTVRHVRPPETSVRFSFKGMMNGVCGEETPTPTPDPCPPRPCVGPLTPIETRQRIESLVI